MKETITSKQGYFIGDIYYCLEDHIYQMWLDACGINGNNFSILSKFTVPKGTIVNASLITEDYTFLVDETAYGDGTYYDQTGREYGVDAGVIGIVPLELVELGTQYELGRAVHSTEPATMEAYEGKFQFTIGSDMYEIDTRDTLNYDYDDEDDDNLDCDDNDGDV